MQRWQVSNIEHRCTLLDFLSERLRISRRRAKALLDTRNVFVNERRVWMARHELRAGDVVEVHTEFARDSAEAAVPILYRDAHYLVANKPAGMSVDGPRGVESMCRHQLKADGAVLVHRLDKDTSGCLILARSRDALDAIISLFEQRRVVKVYDVLVAGRFSEKVKTIRRDVDGREAVTHVMRLAANEHASHLRVRIETGRTHQIRRHMAFVRHPVLGDRQYATAPLSDPLWRAVPRQMLHASQVTFTHPFTGAVVKARAPLPPDFLGQLKRLRLA